MAGVEEVRSVGAVRPIGWEGSRSEREGTRVRGEGGAAGRQQGRPPKEDARPFFFPERKKNERDGNRFTSHYCGSELSTSRSPECLE